MAGEWQGQWLVRTWAPLLLHVDAVGSVHAMAWKPAVAVACVGALHPVTVDAPKQQPDVCRCVCGVLLLVLQHGPHCWGPNPIAAVRTKAMLRAEQVAEQQERDCSVLSVVFVLKCCHGCQQSKANADQQQR